ncbi:MAG TPA: hypothetical protein VNQ77_20120 [Frankiaceae bacterium]|nr:hypothetical protein [Frankiaceae bacterium]
MKRTLKLERETVTDLTTEELTAIAGGIPTFEGPVCYVVNDTQARCTATIIQAHCNTV